MRNRRKGKERAAPHRKGSTQAVNSAGRGRWSETEAGAEQHCQCGLALTLAAASAGRNKAERKAVAAQARLDARDPPTRPTTFTPLLLQTCHCACRKTNTTAAHRPANRRESEGGYLSGPSDSAATMIQLKVRPPPPATLRQATHASQSRPS